jgi:hypothetical protein
MAAFVKGMELCQQFYSEAVLPVLNRHFPNLTHSAGRLGPGSDVLGFDTPMSMDHDWGPRTTLFLSEPDLHTYHQQIEDALLLDLPREIHGFPTFFSVNEDGTERPQEPGDEAANHSVDVTTGSAFFEVYIGKDPLQPLDELDWLSFPSQHLRTIASGQIFHDGLGHLEIARTNVSWYPDDIWLYLMANQWRRIDQEEPFLGRCGDVGDELGSQIIACRMITELMRLCFLMAKSYPPYFKWFGTAFSRLGCAKKLTPIFHRVLSSGVWQEREKHLSEAYMIVSQMHNDLNVTPTVQPEVSPFHRRPFLVPHAERFVDALHGAIKSSAVRALPRHAGAIWQFVDSTDVQSHSSRCMALTSIYQA